jgi:acyl-CoA synthetase (AMP-forming)/AMP-acid ligase II
MHSDPVLSTIDALERAAQTWPDRPFIIDGDAQWTFAGTLGAVETLAAGLISQGFAAGQRAAVWGPNCAEWIIAALAIQRAGGTLVTLNTRYKGNEADQVLQDAGASILFRPEEFLGTDYGTLLTGLPSEGIPSIVLSQTHPSWQTVCQAGQAALKSPEGLEQARSARAAVSGDSISDILFTSGTTGRAKGVMTQQHQNIKAFSYFAEILGLSEDDRYLIINPFFHSFGYKAGWLACLLSGCTAYPMPTFDVEAVLQAIEQNRITVMPGPPTLFQSIINHPERSHYRLQSLTKATTGAAVIPTQLIVDIREKLGVAGIITAYGLSETCGLVTMCRPGDDAQIIAETSGRSIPEVEVAIHGENGVPVPAGDTGEIVVRGFNVMQGYLDLPEATAETIDADGWLHTGDIGSLDHAGNLRITDRLKDMYITGGFNCYPAEIENNLLRHVDVAQCAVIGVADERLGEVGAAFIVAQEGRQATEEEMRLWCREQMANYKVPRHYIWLDSLPLNASGKVLKTSLRELYGQRQQQSGDDS